MITKFKIYEAINIGEPKVGDYVLIDPDRSRVLSDNVKFYLKTNIGRIRYKKFDKSIGDIYIIDYYDIPIDNSRPYRGPMNVTSSFIKYWCKNKRSALIEFEPYITANKYNL